MTDRSSLGWWALGWPSDPIPGDPERVSAYVTHCNTVHEKFGWTATKLRTLHTADGTQSLAVEAVKKNANEVADGLQAAGARYQAIGAALLPYVSVLREAQSKSAGAAEDAVAARGSLSRAQHAQREASGKLLNADEASRAQAQEDLKRTQASTNAANAALADAKRRLHESIASRDSGAATAASKIDMDLKDSSLNDSFWDKAGAVLQWVWDNIDFICLVLDCLAMVLVFTGVGGPLAAALMAISKVLKFVSALKTTVQVVLAVKDGDWLKAGGIVLGYVLGKALNRGGDKLMSWVNKGGVGKKIISTWAPKSSQKLTNAFYRMNQKFAKNGGKSFTFVNKQISRWNDFLPKSLTAQSKFLTKTSLPDFVKDVLRPKLSAQNLKPSVKSLFTGGLTADVGKWLAGKGVDLGVTTASDWITPTPMDRVVRQCS